MRRLKEVSGWSCEGGKTNMHRFFFSSRRRHTRYWRDWEFRRVLFRSLQDIAPHPEGAAGELEVVARVLDAHQIPQDVVEVVEAAPLQEDDLRAVLFGASQTVDRRDARDHYDVAPGEEGARRGVPEAVYVLVDLGILLDKGIGLRDVGLG